MQAFLNTMLQFMVSGPFLLVCYLGYMEAYTLALFLVGELGQGIWNCLLYSASYSTGLV